MRMNSRYGSGTQADHLGPDRFDPLSKLCSGSFDVCCRGRCRESPARGHRDREGKQIKSKVGQGSNVQIQGSELGGFVQRNVSRIHETAVAHRRYKYNDTCNTVILVLWLFVFCFILSSFFMKVGNLYDPFGLEAGQLSDLASKHVNLLIFALKKTLKNIIKAKRKARTILCNI